MGILTRLCGKLWTGGSAIGSAALGSVIALAPVGARAGLVESGELFLRGDCNGDGEVIGSVADAMFLLNYNFLDGPEPPCLAACDANGDGHVVGSVADAAYLLAFNFQDGPPPPAPFPGLGFGEVIEPLTCDSPPTFEGSCVNQCDGDAGACWCDVACGANGDCCADYEAWCVSEDEQAITDLLVRPEPFSLFVDATMLRPSDEVLTLMVETTSGMALGLELGVAELGIGAVPVEVLVYPDTIYDVWAIGQQNAAIPVSNAEIPGALTAPEEETRYYCHRTDGEGGPILKGKIAVEAGGVEADVAVNLRRDPLEQAGQEILFGEGDGGGASGDGVWGLSWFSDDCGTAGGECPPDDCKVTLSALIDLAEVTPGINVPNNPTFNGLKQIINNAGIGFSGTCRESYLFGFIPVGCQCWLLTF